MAKCDQGYLCDVCGQAVEDITESDLYLRYVLREVSSRELLSTPERHIRCNATLAQFIQDARYEGIEAQGPFAKSQLDPADVAREERRVTAAWRRLQEVRRLRLPISDYPLPSHESTE